MDSPPYLLREGIPYWEGVWKDGSGRTPPVLIKERAIPYWERGDHFPKMQTNMHLRGVWYAFKGG